MFFVYYNFLVDYELLFFRTYENKYQDVQQKECLWMKEELN